MKAPIFWRKAHRVACYLCVPFNTLRQYCAMRRDAADGIYYAKGPAADPSVRKHEDFQK